MNDYQDRVDTWMLACFGPEIAADKTERNHRFLEEALELVQAAGCTQSEAHQLVDYVYGRPVGEMRQEVGGVMVTLAALCSAHEAQMDSAAEVELERVWGKIDAIRAKQAAKPKHGPLPEEVIVVGAGRMVDTSEVGALVWTGTLDDDWLCEVRRKGGYLGQLTLTNNGRAVLDEEVVLAYGAAFGPDVDDVRSWQEKCEAALERARST